MNDLSGLWEPLDQAKYEIRVLLLKPSAVEDAPLEGRLENKSLNQPLHFDAISYAWGGAQPSIPLVLVTKYGSVEIPLTEHVGTALRSLRQSVATIALWIDAICISQRDRGEREQQIGMLHHIFHRAAQVHVYLGKQSKEHVDIMTTKPGPRRNDQNPNIIIVRQEKYDEDYPRTIRPERNDQNPNITIVRREQYEEREEPRRERIQEEPRIIRERIQEEPRIIRERCQDDDRFIPLARGLKSEDKTTSSEQEERRWGSGRIGSPLNVPASRLQRSDEPGFDELMLVGHAVYWDRLWVVGEIALARHLVLHHGRHSTDVRFLMQQIERSKSPLGWPLPKFLKDLFDLRTVLPSSVGLSPDEKAGLLLSVMNRARTRQVGDARDRVHAFIGLYNALFDDEMRADYSASLAMVYTAFAKRLIIATSSLRILSQANGHYTVTPNLPSWVPDWASMYDHAAEAFDSSWWDAHIPRWSFQPVSLDRYNGHWSLVVEGDIFRTVSATADVLEGCTSRATAVATLAAWEKFFEELPPDRDDSRGTFASILRRGVLFEQKSYDRFSMLAVPARPVSPRIHLTNEERNRFPEDFKELINKRLFVTKSGRPGIGPRHMRKGDKVALLAGANVPFLLRPYTGGPLANDADESRLVDGTPGFQSPGKGFQSQEVSDSAQAHFEGPTPFRSVYQVVGPCFVAGYMRAEPEPPEHQHLSKFTLV